MQVIQSGLSECACLCQSCSKSCRLHGGLCHTAAPKVARKVAQQVAPSKVAPEVARKVARKVAPGAFKNPAASRALLLQPLRSPEAISCPRSCPKTCPRSGPTSCPLSEVAPEVAPKVAQLVSYQVAQATIRCQKLPAKLVARALTARAALPKLAEGRLLTPGQPSQS